MQVLEGCLQFVSIAEAFTGCSLPLRTTVLFSLAACVDSCQNANMEALRMSLALEDWQPLNAPGGSVGANSSNAHSSSNIDVGSLKQQLSSSPYLLPAHGQAGCVADFDAWVQAGNPFTVQAHTRAVGGEPSPPLAHPMLVRMQLYNSLAGAPNLFMVWRGKPQVLASCFKDTMMVV
jgi:hypothetical protein